jgi:16S rRNA (cytosine967-C5)-methyltransferase
MPTWLVRRWAEARGRAETEALLHRLNERPTYALHLLDVAPTDLDDLGVSWTASPYVDGMVRVEALQPIVQAGWLAEGRVMVQGEGAALVVDLLDPQPGDTVLDLCAAPGTKTRLVAHRMNGQGRVWANDHSAHRLQALQEAPGAPGIIETHTADARTLTPDDAPDAPTHVLLDVPCTGTGVLGRRADLRWRRSPNDVQELVALQDELLEAAARLVPPEGILVYSTCSLLPQENEERIQAFLDRHSDFEVALPTHLPSEVQHDGFLQADPVAHGTDGAFGARLHRTGA